MCVGVFLCVLVCVAYLRAASLNRCVASLVFSRSCHKNAPATDTHRATTAHAHTHTLAHLQTCGIFALKIPLWKLFVPPSLLLVLLLENYFSQALQSGENFSPKPRQFCGQLGAIFFSRHSKLCVCVCVGAWHTQQVERGVGTANWWKPLDVRRDEDATQPHREAHQRLLQINANKHFNASQSKQQ